MNQAPTACDVQQLAAGDRWNTVLSETTRSDAERAVSLLSKSGERNLRIKELLASQHTEHSRPQTP